MARIRKITDQQILEAAQAVFLEQGFGASTLEIAKRAGISEGSIFKRFSTKDNLFACAMEMSGISSWVSFLEAIVGQGDLKDNLKLIGIKGVDFFRANLPKMMMVMSKGIPISALMNTGFAPPVRTLKALTRFFEKEIALGRMQADSAQTLAMIFLGSVMEYTFLSQSSMKLPEAQDYVDFVVDTFWKSIEPTP